MTATTTAVAATAVAATAVEVEEAAVADVVAVVADVVASTIVRALVEMVNVRESKVMIAIQQCSIAQSNITTGVSQISLLPAENGRGMADELPYCDI